MKVRITIEDDNGNILIGPKIGSAEQPIEWKSPPGSPFTLERSEGNGAYHLWGFIYQPRITLNLQWKKPLEVVKL